ncbi:MAG TPA: tryptophan synthase subunit beta [Candidatus Limnocylindria bacterium]|nr:tryptophan synthase subunit beta [Candidatus Limnocylindria bacterium]
MTLAKTPGAKPPKGTFAADAGSRTGGNGSTRDRRGVAGEIADRRLADLRPELDALDPKELARRVAAAPAPRPFAERFASPGLHLIAEIKRSSPSAGRIAADADDVVARARAYQAGGAAAISVLCELHWFGGSVGDLTRIRSAVTVPVLAKEFVVDARQLDVLRAAGADAVLLLAVLHPKRALGTIVVRALDLGLEPLVEAHDEREIEAALATRARVIGINNRDLRTLKVDPERAARLRELVPDDRIAVAESGVRDAATIRGWRALGFDAVLVGEALVRAGDPESATRAFVAAGRPSIDPVEVARVPFVKICAITDEAGVTASIRAGADAIGLNLVPGTPRALNLDEAATLARFARAAAAPIGRRPQVVAITVDRSAKELNEIAAALDADAIQLSGGEPPSLIAALDRPAWKVVHLPPEPNAPPTTALPPTPDAGSRTALPSTPGAPVTAALPLPPGRPVSDHPLTQRHASIGMDSTAGQSNTDAAPHVHRARAFLEAGAARILVDTSGGMHPGGTGTRANAALVAQVARQVPVVLAGGLDPSNVGGALRGSAAVGVDVASGTEEPRTLGARPRKDALRVALFVKRARAARADRPNTPDRPTPVDPGLLEADANGRWGIDRAFGGRYVPETLMAALAQLESAYDALRQDPRFWSELRELLATFAGRPTPLYRADRLAEQILNLAHDATTGGVVPATLRLYLKREDLAHTGAHKINNALGQALLTRRLGKTRVIAETGAGQHGVATATACALLGLPCVVYMGAEDIERQQPNVLRMHALGAEVRDVHSGSATLKDAINEAMRDWVTNVQTTHYVLGSAMGPHPYPTIVRDLQRRIGDEAAVQLQAAEGRLPDLALACVGGGSNAIGLLSRFIGEPSVRLAVAEAAGDGIATGRHAAALAGGTPGILHGARSMMLQDRDGQVVEAVSASAGLDYPGVGPQLSALHEAGRIELAAATDDDAFAAMAYTAETEGILPALETAHAIAALPRLLAGAEGSGVAYPAEALVLLGFSGRGDKDLASFGRWRERHA